MRHHKMSYFLVISASLILGCFSREMNRPVDPDSESSEILELYREMLRISHQLNSNAPDGGNQEIPSRMSVADSGDSLSLPTTTSDAPKELERDDRDSQLRPYIVEALGRIEQVMNVYRSYARNRTITLVARPSVQKCNATHNEKTDVELFDDVLRAYCHMGSRGTHLAEATSRNGNVINRLKNEIVGIGCRIHPGVDCNLNCTNFRVAQPGLMSIQHDYHDILVTANNSLSCMYNKYAVQSPRNKRLYDILKWGK